MTLDDVIKRLAARLDGGLLTDPGLRARVIAQYEDGTLEGIPTDAVISVRFERPRSEQKLKKQLGKLDRVATSRWGMGLPEDFVRLYVEHGWPTVAIRWHEDGEEEGAGCGFSSPSEILRSSWTPDCFQQTESGPAFFVNSTPVDSLQWLSAWIESGFPPHGPD